MKKPFLSIDHSGIKETLVDQFTKALQENQRSLINIDEELSLVLIELDQARSIKSTRCPIEAHVNQLKEVMSHLELVAITLKDLLDDHVIDRLYSFIINVMTCQDDMLNLEQERFNTSQTYFNTVKPWLTYDQMLCLALADLFLMVHGDDFFLFQKMPYFYPLHEISDAYFIWLCHYQLTHLFFHEVAMPLSKPDDLDLTPSKKSDHLSIRATSIAVLKSISPVAQSSYQRVDNQTIEKSTFIKGNSLAHGVAEEAGHQEDYALPSHESKTIMNEQVDGLPSTTQPNLKSYSRNSNGLSGLDSGRPHRRLLACFNLADCALGHKKRPKTGTDHVELTVNMSANQALIHQSKGSMLCPSQTGSACEISKDTHASQQCQQEMPASVMVIRRLYFEKPLRLSMHDWYLSAKFGLWGHDVHLVVFRMTAHASTQRRRAKIDHTCKIVSKLNLFKFDPAISLALKGVCK